MSELSVGAELALLVDAGSAWAKAAAIGRVRGRWRVVAHAAQPTAWGAEQLRSSLIEQLEASADPRLAGRHGSLIDRANRIECHTARRPGRLAVVAVSRELSGSTARRAAESAGWEIATIVTLDDGRALADRLTTLQAAEVDAWLLAGGFEEGASPRGAEAAALVAAARLPGSAPVIWAGSASLAGDVSRMFEEGAVTSVPNARPGPRRDEPGPLREHLRMLLRDMAGGEDESHLASVAFPRAIGTLAASSGLTILGVDLGARSAVRVSAEANGTTAVRVSAGGGLAGVSRAVGGVGRVARLASDAGDEAAVADLVQTLRAHPATVPELPEELAVLQAAARVQLTALMEDSARVPVDLVIGAGRTIAAAPHPAQSMRMLLDGLRPIGVTQIAVDAASLLGPLGSLADDEVGEGLALLADDLLLPLGTSVVCRGGEPGQVAMRVTVHRPGWPTPAPLVVRVGQLQVVPLPRGSQAELVIEPGPGIGLGTSRRAARISATATGGAIGVVLDARGVPIALPRRADDRRAVLAGWADALAREPEGVA